MLQHVKSWIYLADNIFLTASETWADVNQDDLPFRHFDLGIGDDCFECLTNLFVPTTKEQTAIGVTCLGLENPDLCLFPQTDGTLIPPGAVVRYKPPSVL